jgi:DNA-directed RNA polymerase subunit M/transcription elongation factor TFIIS
MNDRLDALNPPKYPNSIPLEFDIFYKENYVAHRRLKIILISEILGQLQEFRDKEYKEKVSIICSIEQGCYDEACRQVTDLDLDIDWDNPMLYSAYNYIVGNLLQNIDPNSMINSRYLLDKIMSGTIDLTQLGHMSSEDLCPEKSAEIRNRIAERSDVKVSTKSSTMYRCSKCKKNECTLERRHTRGLDEATNYRATCIFCKHSWNI